MRTGIRLAGLIAAATLAAIGCLHAVWATGRPWPARSKEQFAATVLGPLAQGKVGALPSAGLTWVIAALLWLASLTLLGRMGLWGRWLPRWMFRRGAWTLTGVLMVRAIGGFIVSTCSDAVKATPFGRWNALLYSPLCLVLGLLCRLVASAPETPKGQL